MKARCIKPCLLFQVNPKKKVNKGKVPKEKKGGKKKASFRRGHGHPKHAVAPHECPEPIDEAEVHANPPPHAVHRQWFYQHVGMSNDKGSRNFVYVFICLN